MTHDFPVLDRLGGLCEDRAARVGRMSEGGMEGRKGVRGKLIAVSGGIK